MTVGRVVLEANQAQQLDDDAIACFCNEDTHAMLL